MPVSVRFAKTCPTCGRALQIQIELLGKDVCCHGCGAAFRAVEDRYDNVSNPAGCADSLYESVDQRVDRLIQEADRQLARSPSAYSV